jgi:Spy/CpxP family protein refolding chaperone
MIDKLQIDDAQIEMIREAMNENRTAERATRKSRGEIMKTAFARLNPNGANGAQNNAGNGNGNVGGAGNNGNGNNGRNAGGRGGRGNFDPEAMRKVMESPEVKAQMEEIQSQEEKLTALLTNAIYKIMSPRQRTTFKKMLGAPFDRSTMGGGGPWGGRGGAARGGNNQATAKTTTTATDDDDDDAPKAKPSTVAAPAKPKASAAAAKKKSLRELRGVPSDDN